MSSENETPKEYMKHLEKELEIAIARAEKAENIVEASAFDLQGLVNEVEGLRAALEACKWALREIRDDGHRGLIAGHGDALDEAIRLTATTPTTTAEEART